MLTQKSFTSTEAQRDLMRCSQQTLSWQIRCRFTLISSEFRNIFMGASTSYLVLLLQAGGNGRHAGEATLLGAAAPEASQTGAEPSGTFEGDVARESGGRAADGTPLLV